MVIIIKTCDQYPYKFHFGYFFSSIIVTPFCEGKIDFQKKAPWRNWVISFCLKDDEKNLGEILVWKMIKITNIFWLTNIFFSNLNTINLEYIVGYTGFRKIKKTNNSWEMNSLEFHRNMKGCVLEVSSRGLG